MIKPSERLLRQHWIELTTRMTEHGREKLCPKCQEWWPHDETCYGWIPSRGHYRSWCISCEVNSTRVYRKRIAQKAVAHTQL
ncbi:hypothetical protein [Pseudomonas sp.]|uniref:hypothetical protein n=1 Tax=Pseudomonas sp. TaxID=306 RepID=UPI003FD7BACC